jgi:DNA-binding response OmpR family regulator
MFEKNTETKILLVEDLPELPSELASLLFEAGYHVLNIADPDEAFPIISSHQPEIIIINDHTGIAPGIPAEFKTASEGPVKVIIISEDPVTGSEADHYISGPVPDSEILEQIKAIFS